LVADAGEEVEFVFGLGHCVDCVVVVVVVITGEKGRPRDWMKKFSRRAEQIRWTNPNLIVLSPKDCSKYRNVFHLRKNLSR
jgi:hypothetical protein